MKKIVAGIVLFAAGAAVMSFWGCERCAKCDCSDGHSASQGTGMNDGSIQDVPVACSLDEAHLAARKKLLHELTRDVVERRELDDGFAYRFDAKPGIVTRLARLVDLERGCCKFLAFRIEAGQADRPVWLEVRGPAGTKEMIEEVFAGK